MKIPAYMKSVTKSRSHRCDPYKTHRYGNHNQPDINRVMAVHEEHSIRICVFVDAVIEHAEIIT